MLDDFALADVRRAVELRNAQPGKRKELEVSGGVSADGLAAIGGDRRRLRLRRRAHEARTRDRFLDAFRLARSHRPQLRAAVRRDFGAPARRYAAAWISRFGSATP